MPITPANGISVYHETYGTAGTAEPLILISGLGGDHNFWAPNIEALSARFRVVVFDNRGIGRTDAPETPYTMEMLADDLAGLMDSLQIERANILGLSLGGDIAMAFALKYPERCLRLVLTATFARMNPQVRRFLDAVLQAFDRTRSPKVAFDLIAPWLFTPEFLAKRANLVYLAFDEDAPHTQTFHGWRNQYMAQQGFDVRQALSRITAPTLVLAGERDHLAHIEDAQLIAAGIPGAELEIIPHAAHALNFEAPGRFHEAVLMFLSRPLPQLAAR